MRIEYLIYFHILQEALLTLLDILLQACYMASYLRLEPTITIVSLVFIHMICVYEIGPLISMVQSGRFIRDNLVLLSPILKLKLLSDRVKNQVALPCRSAIQCPCTPKILGR